MNYLFLHKFSPAVLLGSKLESTSLFCCKEFCTGLMISKPLLKSPVSTSIPSRNFWETFPAISNLHTKDGLNYDNHNIIFRGTMFNYAFYGQFLTMTAFGIQSIFLAKYAYKMFIKGEVLEPLSQVGSFALHLDWTFLLMIGMSTLQGSLICIFAQRVLLRAYHNTDTDEYIFVSLGKNPFSTCLTYCKEGELTSLHRENLLAFFGNYKVKEKKLFLRPEAFKSAYHYNRLIGVEV